MALYPSRTPGRRSVVSSPVAASRTATPAAPGPNEPQFSDPSIARLEQHAVGQFQQNTTPAQGSGQQQFEDYLSRYGQQLQGPAYSSSEYSTLTGGALDSIERDKSAQKQRFLEELGRRGINPSSGVALDGLLKIDNHYAGLRTQTQSGFAQNAIRDTRENQRSAVDIYGALAGAQTQRANQATQYASLPYQLQQDAFNRNMSLVNGGGAAPSNVLASSTQLAQANQMATQANRTQQAQAIQALLQYLAYINGGQA